MNTLLLGKIVSQLLLPPGGLVLAGLAGLICWRRRWGRVLVLLSFACLWLLSTEPVRDALVGPLESRFPALNAATVAGQGTVIVLLGGGIYERAPEYGGRDELGPQALVRTVYAAEIARETGLPVYATGGKPFSQAVEAEGAIMVRWLIRLGLPAPMMHAEPRANNTWENARNIRELLESEGVRRVILVTSAWHMLRAQWCFEKQGLDVVPAPTAYIARRGEYDIRSYLPRWNVFADSAQTLHEYLGLLWYRLRYG